MNPPFMFRSDGSAMGAAGGQPMVRITPRPMGRTPAKRPAPPWANSSPIRVARAQTPYWREQGWVQVGNEFSGQYRVENLAFAGKAIQSSAGDVEMLIRNTPQLERLMTGQHQWSCFIQKNSEWFLVHTNGQIEDVSSGLLEIEAILRKAHESKRNPKPLNLMNHYERPEESPITSLFRRLFD